MVKKIGVMISMPEGPGFKSRSGQIAYFHGVKTRLSTLGTGDVPRGSDSTYNSTVCLSLGDIKERLERLESPLPVLAWGFSAILGIRLGHSGLSVNHLASLSLSHLGCNSRRFHSETT